MNFSAEKERIRLIHELTEGTGYELNPPLGNSPISGVFVAGVKALSAPQSIPGVMKAEALVGDGDTGPVPVIARLPRLEKG